MTTDDKDLVADDEAIKTGSDHGSHENLAIAAVELVIAAAIVVGANVFDVVPISETPWLVLIGWLSLRLRRSSWKDLGLRSPKSWIRTASLALAAAVFLQLFSEFVIERLAGRPDLSAFRDLEGDLLASSVMLLLVWTFAAFGEEMAYRGYVLDRAAAVGGRTKLSYLVSVFAVAVLFGIGHYYQGMSGVAGSAFSGLFFGVLYLYSGRNLWLPILTHGLSDTIGLALIYSGNAPGL